MSNISNWRVVEGEPRFSLTLNVMSRKQAVALLAIFDDLSELASLAEKNKLVAQAGYDEISPYDVDFFKMKDWVEIRDAVMSNKTETEE